MIFKELRSFFCELADALFEKYTCKSRAEIKEKL